jgi:formate dehydrogenase iron-sulfur subunit
MAENCYYYDGSRCIACRSCQVACKQWNRLPGEKTKFFAAAGGYQNPVDLSPITWNIIKFHERDTADGVEWLFRRHHCFHCTKANCIEVCPVEPKAMTRHPVIQMVYVNKDLCIGCGSCEDACPFGVPHVDENLEKSQKCTGCIDRVTNDLPTACVKTCPTQAIRYGTREDMYALAEKRVQELKAIGYKDANVYGPGQLGGTHSIYVLLAPLDVYALPANPTFGDLESIKERGREKYAAWQREHGKSGVSLAGAGPVGATVALGAAALAGLNKLAERKERIAAEEEKKG